MSAGSGPAMAVSTPWAATALTPLVEQAEAAGHAVHVGVDRHRRPPQREQQHAGGRLGPHAGQALQVGEGIARR
jgi:hypothetical protein